MDIPASITAAINSGAISARWLIWIKARNRTTNAVEALGVSTLDDDASFTIAGETRAYAGAGPVVGLPEITYETGTVIQNQRLTLSIISPEVINAIRAYDARFAPVEMRIVFFSTTTGKPLDTVVAYTGTIDAITIKEGETSTCEVVVSSLNRGGTRTLAHKKSDAAQKLRNANDNGRRYASIAGSVEVAWGMEHDTVFSANRNIGIRRRA